MNRPLQLPGVDQGDIAQADSLLRADIKTELAQLKGMTWGDRLHSVLGDLWDFGLKVMVVIAIFLVGRWLIRRIVRLLDVIFEKRRVDPSLRSFVRGLFSTFLYLVLFYLMIAWLGVNTSLFVALFAAAGLAIGMALSGVFQNFAGGVMILLLKPFHYGDWIEVQGQSGSVTDIRLFNTVLLTAENKTILIPNGSVSGSIVNNYNTARTRRLEWTVSFTPGTSLPDASKAVEAILRADSRILPEPSVEILTGKLNIGSLDLIAHGWVVAADVQDVFSDINARLYTELPAQGLAFPSSQTKLVMDGTVSPSACFK